MTVIADTRNAALRLQGVAGLESVPDARQLCFLPLHVVLTALVAIACLTAVSLRLYEPDAYHDSIAIVCGLTSIGLMIYAHYGLGLAWTAPSMAYLVLFSIFHFGLVFTAALAPDVLATYTDRRIEWMRWPNVRMAMILGLLGSVGFVFGAGLIALRPFAPQRLDQNRAHHSVLYTVGWILMVFGLAMYLLTLVRNGGGELLALSNREFKSTVLLPTGMFMFGQVSQLGCLLAICGAGGRRWVRPFSVWLAFGCFILLLGQRSRAMVPLLTFVLILMQRGVRFNRGLLLAGILTTLLVIPAIATIRAVGFSNRASVNWTNVSPVETFMELGGTLRAVKAYVDWIEAGDSYLLGASYWAPLDRHLLVWLLPGRERTPIEQDTRVPGQYMSERERYPTGTAASGEAYYNFGPAGPFIFCALVGALFVWLERRSATSRYSLAILGSVMFLFYFNIRGQWIHVATPLAAALVLLAFCYTLDRMATQASPNGRSTETASGQSFAPIHRRS